MNRIALHRIALTIAATLALLGMVTASPGRIGATDVDDFCADAEEQAFLTLINDYRVANGLVPLAATQSLSAAA